MGIINFFLRDKKYFITAGLIFISACSKQLEVPPINEKPLNNYTHGKVIWYDLLTDNPALVKSFYGSLFGWTFEESKESEGKYFLIKHDGKSVGGIIHLEDLSKDVDYSQWLPYLSVDDVDKSVEYFNIKGGNIIRDAFEFPNRGRTAAVQDPEGAVIAILKSSSGDPEDNKAVIDEFFWNELWSNNMDNALSFYSGFLGYEKGEIEGLKIDDYYVLHKDNKPRIGIKEIPFKKEVKPNWLSYIAVDDTKTILDKVEDLGGKILIAVDGSQRGSAAIISDPSGAVFGIQKWPIEKLKEQ